MKTTTQDDRFYATISELLTRERYKVGMTQEEVGDAVGLTRISIVGIEAGRNRPGLHLVRRMVNLYRKRADFKTEVPTYLELIREAERLTYKTRGGAKCKSSESRTA